MIKNCNVTYVSLGSNPTCGVRFGEKTFFKKVVIFFHPINILITVVIQPKLWSTNLSACPFMKSDRVYTNNMFTTKVHRRILLRFHLRLIWFFVSYWL